MAQNGSDVLITTQVGGVDTVVGSQRNVDISEAVSEIDVSNKDAPEMKVIGGRYSATLSLEALYVPTNAAYNALKSAFRSRTLVQVKIREAGATTNLETFNALITALNRSHPDQGESTTSIDMRVSGAIGTSALDVTP